MEEIVGHEQTVKSNTHDNYANPYNLRLKQKEIDKLKFNINVDKIKAWDRRWSIVSLWCSHQAHQQF